MNKNLKLMELLHSFYTGHSRPIPYFETKYLSKCWLDGIRISDLRSDCSTNAPLPK